MNLRRSRPMDAPSHSTHRVLSELVGLRLPCGLQRSLQRRCQKNVKKLPKSTKDPQLMPRKKHDPVRIDAYRPPTIPAASSDRNAGTKGAYHQTLTVEERLNGARLVARVSVLREELDAT